MANTLHEPSLDFWTSLLVDTEAIGDDWRTSMAEYLGKLTHEDLAVIERVLGMPAGDASLLARRAEFISCHPQAQLLLFLRQFSLRKLAAIEEVWPDRKTETKFNGAPFVKLVLLFKKNPDILWDIFITERWLAKSSGSVFVPDDDRNFAHTAFWDQDILNALASFVSKETGYSIRVVRTFSTADFTTVLMYRGEPKLVEGFLQPERMNTARDILVQLKSTPDQRILTIKAVGQVTVEDTIKVFLEDLFKTSFTARADYAYRDYDEQTVSSAFRAGGLNRELKVRSIAVRSHNLPDGPVVAVEVDESKDAGDAFARAVSQNEALFTINSLLDIHRLEVEVGNQGSVREIRVEELPSSEVKFTIKDHGITPNKFYDLAKKFLGRFGVPLNQPIDHTKFAVGLGKQYDFLLSCEQERSVPLYQRKLFNDLQVTGLLRSVPIKKLTCSSCDAVLSQGEACLAHPKAMSVEIVVSTNWKVDVATAYTTLLDLLEGPKWSGSKIVHRINGTQYQFIKLEREVVDKVVNRKEAIWVYPAFETLSVADFKALQSVLTPVLIVWVGKAKLSHQAAEVGMLPSVTMGQLVAWRDLGELNGKLGRLYEDTLAEVPTRLVIAASRARARLAKLLVPGPVVDYTPDQFEHDVYVLLKQMYPLSVPLGGRRRGQAVPDGLIDFWLEHRRPYEPRVYMYDAKLSVKGTGYDLDLDEERKAWDYIQRAQDSSVLQSYMQGKDLTGYLFVSNKYRDDDPQSVSDFIRDHSDWTGPIACLTVKDLLVIHGYWSKYREELSSKEQQFREAFVSLIAKASPVVRDEGIDKQFLHLVQSHIGIPAHRLDIDELVSQLIG